MELGSFIDLTHFQELFVNYTTFCNIITISLCCIAAAFFILRLNHDTMLPFPSSLVSLDNISEQTMTGVTNPFHISLSERKTSSLTDGIYIDIAALQTCELQLLWAVPIHQFHEQLQRPWASLLENLMSGRFLDGAILHSSCIKFEAEENVHCRHYLVPEVVSEDILGPIPRSVYPLVVAMYSTGTPAVEDEDKAISAMFCVIHLKDKLCPLNSHVLNQFLKTNRNEVYHLQPLFVSSSNSAGGDAENSPTTENVNNDTMTNNDGVSNSSESLEQTVCIVCQTNGITRAFLPCRHACVCDTCFVHLDRCPLCRMDIATHFRLSGEDESPRGQIRCELDPARMHSQTWWENFNERLNNFFGFS